MNLKIGGNDVVKIMYNGQEFGGATKLEPGTIVYLSNSSEYDAKNVHLLSTTKNWSNLNGINLIVRAFDDYDFFGDINITGYDFKNLDKEKTYKMKKISLSITVSRSIVDGEYKLELKPDSDYRWLFEIKAL